MCVAMPGIVKRINENVAVVDFSGNQIEAEKGFLELHAGDRVLVHAGMILQKVSASEADELEALFAELNGALEQ